MNGSATEKTILGGCKRFEGQAVQMEDIPFVVNLQDLRREQLVAMAEAVREVVECHCVLAKVVSDSWWKLVFGVAPNHDGCSIRRRGQLAG